MQKCKKCYKNKFIIKEEYRWEGTIDPDTNALDCFSQEGGIHTIYCSNCGEEYKCEDFTDINFN